MTDKEVARQFLKDPHKGIIDLIIRYYLLQLAHAKLPEKSLDIRIQLMRKYFAKMTPSGKLRLYRKLLGLGG